MSFQAPGFLWDVVETVGSLLTYLGFWMAVGLPFLYLPLLLGGFLSPELPILAGILVIHLVALVVGRDYNRR